VIDIITHRDITCITGTQLVKKIDNLAEVQNTLFVFLLLKTYEICMLNNKVLIRVDMRLLNCMEILVVLGPLYGLIFMPFTSMLHWLLNHKVFCTVAAICFATYLAGFSAFFAFGPSMK
jgi:hypothetical protein